jgi:hypothetical protein
MCVCVCVCVCMCVYLPISSECQREGIFSRVDLVAIVLSPWMLTGAQQDSVEREYVFKLSHRSRDYFFACDTQEQCDQ